MKKIIVLLLSFMFLTSISACTESSDKLYGVYKDINEERDKQGYVITLTISDQIIEFNAIGSLPYSFLPPTKEDGFWILKNPKNKKVIAKLKEIAPNTIEYIRIRNGEEKSLGKYVKITEEEFKNIQNNPIKPKRKEYPTLF